MNPSLLWLACCLGSLLHYVEAQGNGAVRFYRHGSTSHLFSAGIVQIYYSDLWGNICFTSGWGIREADVVCRQLGWSGASSTSSSLTSANTVSYGMDTLRTALGSVQCSNNSIPVLLQCDVLQPYETGFNCATNNDVAVECYTTRLWDSIGYPGMLRLVGGYYITEGRVEVYCNGEWGTVCDDAVSRVEADTMCKHLGYSQSIRYDHLILDGNATQPIWLDDVVCGIKPQDCLTSCQQCPSRMFHNCFHGEDLTISCTYLENIGGSTLDTCSNTSSSPNKASSNNERTLIVGVVVGVGILVLVIVAMAGFICCVMVCGRRQGREIEAEPDYPSEEKRGATPTMGSLSPEVIQMESSPKMYRKEHQFDHPQHQLALQQRPIEGTGGNQHGNQQYYHHNHPAAYNPTYNEYVVSPRGGDDNTGHEYATTPPAYLGHPATTRFY